MYSASQALLLYSIVIGYAALHFIAAYVAHKKGHPGLLFFILAVVTTPFIAFAIAYFLPPRHPPDEH